MATVSIGGSLFAVPHQATVRKFGFSPGIWQLTNAAGAGQTSVPGGQVSFRIGVHADRFAGGGFTGFRAGTDFGLRFAACDLRDGMVFSPHPRHPGA